MEFPRAKTSPQAMLLLISSKKMTTGVFYRPPNRELHPLEELSQILSEISTSEHTHLNFNISDISWNNMGNLLIDIVNGHFFSQLVSQPTRGLSILDLVLTTSPDYVQDLQVGETFSDHNLISVCPRKKAKI